MCTIIPSSIDLGMMIKFANLFWPLEEGQRSLDESDLAGIHAMKYLRKRSYNIASVQRCLRLLSLFSQSPAGLSASEVAKQSALPVSTVHRFLINLENAGFLDCSETGKYHLG